MPARATLLDRLRRSGLGVWLAVAYAWAVLALALAPAPAQAAFIAQNGAVLCSGMPVPGDAAPVPPGDTVHCKGCPLNPVLAGSAADGVPSVGRSVVSLPVPLPLAEGLAHRFATGLAHSRAPPAG